MKRFLRKDGTPTAYAMACGHGMYADHSPDGTVSSNSVSLFQEAGVYIVKAIDWQQRKNAGSWPERKGWNDPAGFRVWNTHTTQNAAIADFNAQARRLNLVRVRPPKVPK